MKFYQKIKFQKDGKIIKKYKVAGITMLRKEKTATKRRYNMFGIKVCKKYKTSQFITPIATPVFNWPKFSEIKSMQTGKIAIIAELSIPQCTLYRVTNKKEALENLGYEVEIASWTDKIRCYEIMQLAEFVIFYRVPFLSDVKEYYAEAERLGIKKIYDIDDLIFDEEKYKEYLDVQPLDKNFKQHLIKDAKLYGNAVAHSDELWTTTPVIADVAKKYIKLAKIVPNCVPQSLTEIIPQSYNDDKIRIFYGSGTTTHDKDFEYCFAALNNVLRKYENVELYIHGYLNTQDFAKEIQHKIHHIDFVKAEDYYFSISGYDIAVAPLEKNTFSMAKSNIKYIEASMLSIPCIASNLPEFSNIIKNGETGFIAETQKDWEYGLQQLIENADLRHKIARQARQVVLNLYSEKANEKYIKAAIGRKAKTKSEQKKKVLFVNILYGQSSFGGATIVAEEMAQNFNNCYDDWQSFVFTCHVGEPENVVARYDWKGVPIFSNSINNITWDYENQGIADNFAKVLDLVNPDIVHFHCVQKMGVDMMLVCQEQKVPYTLTMHDAWFACARQFFIDEKGKYCDQCLVSAEICKKRCNVSNEYFYHRKNKMFSALKGAAWVCTPSATFSQQLQANFPFIKLDVNTNGISFAGIKAKKNTKTDDIVFGFFGGKEQVKGYFFMRDILNKRKEQNWKIILIDTARKFGHNAMSENEWPKDKAEILGYTPHEKMAELFQRIDVLLFPSQWNESFGLMVREAIANNVFVLCSECGGPKDAIVNGKNGLVFPKNDAQKFSECLDYVFAHQKEIKNYQTSEFGDVRTFKAQTDELKKKFDQIIKKKKQ